MRVMKEHRSELAIVPFAFQNFPHANLASFFFFRRTRPIVYRVMIICTAKGTISRGEGGRRREKWSLRAFPHPIAHNSGLSVPREFLLHLWADLHSGR